MLSTPSAGIVLGCLLRQALWRLAGCDLEAREMALRLSSAGSGSSFGTANEKLSDVHFEKFRLVRTVLELCLVGRFGRLCPPHGFLFNPAPRRDGCLVGISRQTVAHASGDHRSPSVVETDYVALVGRASDPASLVRITLSPLLAVICRTWLPGCLVLSLGRGLGERAAGLAIEFLFWHVHQLPLVAMVDLP